MSEREQKTVRVVANGNSRTVRTVNIVTSRGSEPSEIKACLQAAGAPLDHEYETVQVSGGNFSNLPTIFISGYTGPL